MVIQIEDYYPGFNEPFAFKNHATFQGGLSGANTSGNIYYVDRNVGASGDGKSWDGAFLTITEAITQVNADYTAGTRNDVIFIGEGWYSEVPVTLTANDCYIVAVAPGSHDSTVLYGSATAGGYDINSGGPALKITGSNNTIIGLGFFTYDVLYASLQLGALATGTYGNKIITCSFIRDVDDGSLGGILDYGYDGTLIDSCYFSTSCKDYGVQSVTDGVNNPVNCIVQNCRFVGVPTPVDLNSGHNTVVKDCYMIDDTSDRPGTVTVPVAAAGSTNTSVMGCYSEFSNANVVTSGTSTLAINNFQLATPA